MLLLHQGEEKKQGFTLTDEFCEEEVFLYLLSTNKFGCNAPQDIPIRPAG